MVDCRRNFFYLYFRVLSDKTETIIIIVNTRKRKKRRNNRDGATFFQVQEVVVHGGRGGEWCQG